MIGLSPTQFKLRASCERHWVLNYPMRQRHAEQPQRGKMLGSITHACLEAHARGGSIYRPDLTKLEKEIAAYVAEFETPALDALIAEAPTRAVMVLPYLPTATTHAITPEHPLELDVEAIDPGCGWGLAQGVATDLLADPYAEEWVEIDDYKTTKGAACKKGTEMRHGGQSTGWDPWAYVPDEKELRIDPQVLFYAAYAIRKTGKRIVLVRFLYVCTHGSPRAPKIVTIRLTEDEVADLWREHILPIGRELVRLYGVHKGADPQTVNAVRLPTIPYWDRSGPCQAYGGCPHHISKGGVCRTETHTSLGGLARTGVRTGMGLFDRVRQQDVAMRAPEALQAAAKADPEGAAASGLEVPEIETEPAPVAKVEVAAAPPPKGAGRPRRTAKDSDETYAARIREWERTSNVIVTEGTAVAETKAVPEVKTNETAVEVKAPTTFGPAPAPIGEGVTVTISGDANQVRDLIRRLGGAL